MQGENDALAINQGLMTKINYVDALNSIVQRYRDQLGNALPFFIFQTGTAVGLADTGFSVVRSVQEQISLAPYNRLVYSGAQTFPSRNLMWDEYHYMPEGYREMGRMGAASVVQFLSTLMPPTSNFPSGSKGLRRIKRFLNSPIRHWSFDPRGCPSFYECLS